MTVPILAPPQLVMNSRMLYTSWMPADPEAAAALLPPGARAAGPVYMNQYVVDSAEQTTGFGAYSLTYLGLDLADLKAPDGVTPGRYMLFYFNSSPIVRAYASEHGLPATTGTTELSIHGHEIVATTFLDGRPVIRTTAHAKPHKIGSIARGQLLYLTRKGDRFLAGNFPYIGELADDFSLASIEFLDPSHPAYALRPKSPLEAVMGSSFFAPRNSFVYPGGEYSVTLG
ncbi:Hypothetical protein A7982_00980 [Minicystis rosea]|nr:Hypothetical protein A7982_00980 [Minicystis rosea]